jgi:hypothetical protein
MKLLVIGKEMSKYIYTNDVYNCLLQCFNHLKWMLNKTLFVKLSTLKITGLHMAHMAHGTAEADYYPSRIPDSGYGDRIQDTGYWITG